jgi:hypothetical protein
MFPRTALTATALKFGHAKWLARAWIEKRGDRRMRAPKQK